MSAALNLNLYEEDYYAWTQEQVKFIKEKSIDKLDLQHLLEEISFMGAREKSELKNRLAILLMHLMKWKYQPSRQCKSWRYTINEQRDELRDLLEDNPSLRGKIAELLFKSYNKAVREAIQETGLDDSIFSKNCEWTINQILDDNFLPT